MVQNKTRTIATYGVLTSLALILSYVEAQIPAFFAVPGIRLGLTNLVVLAALYLYGNKGAYFINIVRILLAALLFGTGVSLLYSLVGGMLSVTVMVLLKRIERLHIVSVSVSGAIAHNVGQIIVAMILLGTGNAAWYFTILWISGIICGALIGLLGALILKRIKK